MSKKGYTSNIKKVKYKLEESEKKVLKELSKMLLKPIRQKAKKISGNLRKNIKTSINRKEKVLEIGIKKKAFYGSFIELGTDKIRKKSFIMATIEEKKKEIENIVKKAYKDGLK